MPVYDYKAKDPGGSRRVRSTGAEASELLHARTAETGFALSRAGRGTAEPRNKRK